MFFRQDAFFPNFVVVVTAFNATIFGCFELQAAIFPDNTIDIKLCHKH